MRFIYTILLGMVIFQGMLIVLAPIFPGGATGYSNQAVNPSTLQTNPSSDESTAPDAEYYKETSNIGSIVVGMLFNPTSIVIIGLFAVVGSGAGVVFGGVKNLPIALGIGIIVGVVANIWNGTFTLISTIAQSNWYISGIFSIITVCIGIIVIFLVGEFFLGQSQGVN